MPTMEGTPPPGIPVLEAEGGRRLARVHSYARRGGRLSDRQRGAWDAHHDRWVVPEEALRRPFDATAWFGREAPLVVEIGSGNGASLVQVAAARPDIDVIAFEVWRPGVADTLGRMAAAGVGNVRLCPVDAVEALEHLFVAGQLSEVWTFFPDPWPKNRHHKRRLVTPGFTALVAGRLATGGVWRRATDWPDYAVRMREVLDAEPRLRGGPVPRWDERPVTRFERRGVAEGRTIADLAYRRIADA